MRTPTEVLTSLVADIEAMKCPMPERMIMFHHDEGDWFGGFANGTFDDDNYSGWYINWPNLSILLEEAKEVIK